MYQHKSETDHETCEPAVLILGICDTENCEHKNEGKNDLNNKACNEASSDTCKSVRAEAAGHVRDTTQQEYNCQDRSSHKGSDALSNNVRNKVRSLHPAREQTAE